jgi:hypothetical protein
MFNLRAQWGIVPFWTLGFREPEPAILELRRVASCNMSEAICFLWCRHAKRGYWTGGMIVFEVTFFRAEFVGIIVAPWGSRQTDRKWGGKCPLKAKESLNFGITVPKVKLWYAKKRPCEVFVSIQIPTSCLASCKHRLELQGLSKQLIKIRRRPKDVRAFSTTW